MTDGVQSCAHQFAMDHPIDAEAGEANMLVTLAGYCVHSTVVPAIVPIFFFRQLRKWTRRKNK